MNKGWISINRKLQDHWLWQEKRDFSKLEAWLDILLTVNHTDQKVMIKNTLYNVKRGESIKSLETWGKRWNWNKSKVRRFLKVLESDSMIVTKNESKTTRLTVCKYDSYQSIGNDNETIMKRKRNADETLATPNNNDNNINNENNENNKEKKDDVFNFRKSLIDLGAKEELVIDWLKVRKTKKASNTQTAFNSFVKQLELSKKDINYILETCIVKSWSGFKNDWLKNATTNNSVSTKEDYNNFIKKSITF